MNFNSINDIRKAGFEGFKTMQELFADSSCIPSIRGVYLVLNIDGTIPVFLEKGSGGISQKKDPNVHIELLHRSWVHNTLVVYIGKAGGEVEKSTLQSRLKVYLSFGQGNKVGHRGGRYIWQLVSAKELVVCWKQLPNENPRAHEKQLLINFKLQFGKRPFANRRG